MPFNGSGVFNRVYNWVTDKNNAVNITASRMDTEDTGFATGLSLCLTKDGQQIPTANLPMGGFAHTGVANATAATQYAVVGQIQDSSYNWIAGGGTGDAITATYAPAVTTLVDGMELKFRALGANTLTNPTFSPNSLTAHTITKKGGSALVSGDIFGALAEYTLRYNLANTRWEILNPSSVTTIPFSDASALVKNSSDATKQVTISAASVTAGQNRVLTAQDKNYTIADNADILLKAALASPTFTGTPAAPTATTGDNTTQLATTAFVTAMMAASSSGGELTLNFNGKILKMGSATGATGTVAQTITFAAAFPTSCDGVVTVPSVTGGGGDIGYAAVTSVSTSQFQTQYRTNRYYLAWGS